MVKTKPNVRVCLIDAFDGPRHDKLKLIWKYFAEDFSNTANIIPYCNKGAPLRHGQMLEKIWDERSHWPERYVIFTEFDFLPNRSHFFDCLALSPVAVEYVTRCPDTLQLIHHGVSGAWLLCIDREQTEELSFDHLPDPCNKLQNFQLLKNQDGRPEHYGTDVLPGTHLFFSRHYNDPPELRVAGLSLYDILSGVDRRINRYIKHEMQV